MKKETSVKILLATLGADGYHLFVKVNINGKRCRFLIDTGASKSVIDKGYFEREFGKEKLKTIKQDTAGLHGSVSESYSGKIKQVEIGRHIVKDHNMPAVDLSHVNSTYKKLKKPSIQGILGSDLMLEYKMIVDYGKLKIILP